nr:hypothetical protein [Tanacetum cinerariifolium]
MPYLRFTKVIINHFLTKHNTLPKRQTSFINTIKYDSILGKMKFVSKGKEHQKYGMSIPDTMMNDEIRESAHYMTYLAVSTNFEKENKKALFKKKTITPRKKSSLTVDDNILPDPNEAENLANQSVLQRQNIKKRNVVYMTHINILRISSDEEIKTKAKADEEMKDAKNDESKKAEEEHTDDKQARNEEPIDDHAGSKQARGAQANSSSSSKSLDSFIEYELKNMLYDKMYKSGSINQHQKHIDLYNASIGSIGLDEAIMKGELDPLKVLKKRRHDDRDQDPLVNSTKEKKEETKKGF